MCHGRGGHRDGETDEDDGEGLSDLVVLLVVVCVAHHQEGDDSDECSEAEDGVSREEGHGLH